MNVLVMNGRTLDDENLLFFWIIAVIYSSQSILSIKLFSFLVRKGYVISVITSSLGEGWMNSLFTSLSVGYIKGCFEVSTPSPPPSVRSDRFLPCQQVAVKSNNTYTLYSFGFTFTDHWQWGYIYVSGYDQCNASPVFTLLWNPITE